MRLFNEIAKRGAAILILAATVFATVTYSLGLYEISFIDRKDEEYDDNTIQEILGTLEPGTNISDFTGDISDITLPPEITEMITTAAPGTTSAPDLTQPPETSAEATTSPGIETEPTPAGPTTLAEYLDAGYRITWKDFDPQTQLAELVLDFEGIKVNCPLFYNEWLTRVYGDYMQLPPIEKRKTHHYTEIVDFDKPYTEYVTNK